MSSLELKVPPVLFTLLCMMGMYLFNYLSGNIFSLNSDSIVMRFSLFVLWVIIGVGFALAGKLEFSKANTTVNPMTPEKSSSLVQSGIYQWTRNPMYVGFLACLVGWSLFLMDWMVMLVFLPFFVWYLNKFQIEPEERFLQELFALCKLLEARGPKACPDLGTIPASCNLRSSREVSDFDLVSTGITGPFVDMVYERGNYLFAIQNAFNSYRNKNFTSLNKGVITKFGSIYGGVEWEFLTCGTSNAFFSNVVTTSTQVSIAGYIESASQLTDLCVLKSTNVSYVGNLDGRKISFVTSLDISNGNVRFVKSLDLFNESSILSMTLDAIDNIILAQRVKRTNSSMISLDGISLTLPNQENNIVISEFSSTDGSHKWSSVLCEQLSSDEACQVISIHSSYALDDNILIILSVKGSVNLKMFGRITSIGSTANIFIVGLSKNGQNVRFVKPLVYSSSLELDNVKATINQNGEMIIGLACSENCFINQEMVNPGAYLIQFNMFKLTFDYSKVFVPISSTDNVKISSVSIDGAGNPLTIINSLSSPQITIYDSDSRKTSFTSPNILLTRHSPSGSIYWSQSLTTSTSVGKVIVPTMPNDVYSISTLSRIPVVHQDVNRLKFNTFKPCLSYTNEIGTLGPAGGTGGDSTYKTSDKIKTLTFGGGNTIGKMTVTYYGGTNSYSTPGGSTSSLSTMTFDPEEVILEVEIHIDKGITITNVGYIRIKTDKQEFKYGTKTSIVRLFTMDADKTVIAWTIKSGTYLDSLQLHLGDRSNGYPIYCDCKAGLEGSTCAQTKCYGQDTSSPTVCSGKGSCSSPNTCSCNLGYTGHACIDVAYCNNNSTIVDPLLCGTGSCKNDQCQCKSGYYGEKCQYWDCYGVTASNSSYGCSGNGNCQSPNNCVCDPSKYIGLQCEFTMCNSIPSNNSNVCSGHGVCATPENCACEPNYLGQYCEVYSCYGKDRNSSEVCSGRGKCTAIDQCTCPKGYYGNECELFDCYGKVFSDNLACSSYGKCISPNNCTCLEGYYSNDCGLYNCSGKVWTDPTVCTSIGVCKSPNNCQCPDGYSGQSCEIFNCFDISRSDNTACSGNGQCIAIDTCKCKSNYNGTKCELCADNYYGKQCSNSIPSRNAIMQTTEVVTVKLTSKKYITTVNLNCNNVLSANSISKYGSLNNCKSQVQSASADSNGNYIYTITITYNANPSFIPGDSFEFNVFCLETETPIYTQLIFDDSSLIYTDPVVILGIDTSTGDSAEVHKCFSTNFVISKWSQYEKRANYKSISWRVVGDDSYGTEISNAKNQLKMTIPQLLEPKSTEMTIEILFESYFGKKKLFNFTFPISTKNILPNGSNYYATVRVKNGQTTYLKPSSFLSNSCFTNSNLPAPTKITLVSSTDPLVISYTNEQFSLSYTLSGSPKTSAIKFYQTDTNYINIIFTFTYEIATVNLSPKLYIDPNSYVPVLSCTDPSDYGVSDHVYDIICSGCGVSTSVRSQVLTTYSSLSVDMSTYSLGSGKEILIKCYRMSETSPLSIPYTKFQVSQISSNNLNEICNVLSMRIINLVGNNIPYSATQVNYQVEVLMSSTNCPVKFTLSTPYGAKLIFYDGILFNRLNTISIPVIGGSIEKSGSKIFSFVTNGNLLTLDSASNSYSLTVSAESSPAVPTGCTSVYASYPILDTISFQCSGFSTSVSYAIYLDELLIGTATYVGSTLSFSTKLPIEGSVYLSAITSSGSISKKKITGVSYTDVVFSSTKMSEIRTFLDTSSSGNTMPLHLASFFYYYPIKKPQSLATQEKDIGNLYSRSITKLFSIISLTNLNNPDYVNSLLLEMSWFTYPYMMTLDTFTTSVKFLKSVMSIIVTNSKKNPKLWTKQTTKSLGVILANLNVFSVQIAQMPFSSYSAPYSYLLNSLVRMLGEVNQKDLFTSSLNALSPIAYGKLIRQEELRNLAIADSNSVEWIRLSSRNSYTITDVSSIQEVVIRQSIIKKSTPVSPTAEESSKGDYLGQFSLTGADSQLANNFVYISVPLSSKASYNFYGRVVKCSIVYDTDTWSQNDDSCTLIDTYEKVVSEINGAEKIMIANCSCSLTSLHKSTTTRSLTQTSTPPNNAVGLYVYDNSAAVGVGIFFGLIVPLFYILALVGTVTGVLLYWHFKVKPKTAGGAPAKEVEMKPTSVSTIENPNVTV